MASNVNENLRKKINLFVFSTIASAKSRSLQNLEKEMLEMMGKTYSAEEYRKAGFKDLRDVLKSHKDIHMLPNGEYVAVSADQDLADLTDMVQRQKSNKQKKKSKARRSSSATPFFGSYMHMKPQTGLIPSNRPNYPKFNSSGRYSSIRSKINTPIAISPTLTPDRYVSTTKPGNLLITINDTSSNKTRRSSASAKVDVEPPKFKLVIPPNCAGQSSSKTPELVEFRNNVIEMFRRKNGLEIHIDNLSTEYGKEYGCYFDPYEIYAKKWPTLLKGVFSSHLVVDENKIVRLIGSRPSSAMPNMSSKTSMSMKGRGDFCRPAHLVDSSLNESFSEKERTTLSSTRSQTSMGFGSTQVMGTKQIDNPRRAFDRQFVNPRRDVDAGAIDGWRKAVERKIDDSERAVDRQIGLDPRIARLAFRDLQIQEKRNPIERKIVSTKTPETVPSPPSLFHSPAETIFRAPEIPNPKPKKNIKLPPAVKPIVFEDISKREKIIPRRLTSCCQMNQESEPTNRFERMAREAEFKFDDDDASF